MENPIKSSIELTHTMRLNTLRLVLENNVTSSVGNLGVAGLLTIILLQFINTPTLWWWFGFMASVSVSRLVMGLLLKSKLQQTDYKPVYHHIMFGLVLFTAAGWGSTAFLFIDSMYPVTNAYITVALAGIVAGSTASLIPIKHFFYSFLLLTLIPVLAVYLLMGTLSDYLFALMILFFIAFMLRNGKLFNQNITQNFTLLLQNKTLIDDLQIQTNRALQASDLKSQFLANMSHEIRTPMNAIIGFIHLLKQDETNPKKINYINTITDASDDLLSLINDILDFSKIESNQLVLEKKVFNPVKEVQNCLDLFNAKAIAKVITLQLKTPQNIPNWVNTDLFRVKQILNNLLSNALKFSPDHSSITVELQYDKVTEMLNISVIDQGIGIAKEQQSLIFNAFVQADASTTRQYGGTGLGLAICVKLTQLLGGQLTVESTLGQGSRFAFNVLASISQAEQTPDLTTVNANENAPLIGHIMLVEDNIVNQRLLSALLKKVGLTFEVANDGLEAVTLFERQNTHQRFNVILMDENMPNLCGTQAAQRIRNLEAQQHLTAIPIVAVTANAMQGDAERFLANGFTDYLTKPIQVQKLYAVLKNYLSVQRSL